MPKAKDRPRHVTHSKTCFQRQDSQIDRDESPSRLGAAHMSDIRFPVMSTDQEPLTKPVVGGIGCIRRNISAREVL